MLLGPEEASGTRVPGGTGKKQSLGWGTESDLAARDSGIREEIKEERTEIRETKWRAWMGRVRKEKRLWPVTRHGFQLVGRKASSAVSLLLYQLQCCCFFPSLSPQLHGGWHWAGLTSAATSCCILCYLEIFYWYHPSLTLLHSSPSQLSFRCPICSNCFSPLTRALLSIGPAPAFCFSCLFGVSFLIASQQEFTLVLGKLLSVADLLEPAGKSIS